MSTNKRTMPWLAVLLFLLIASFTPTTVGAQGGNGKIRDSKHNLSSSGKGPFKASSQADMCLFCHAPHKARKQRAMWNRQDSTQVYLTYSSSTFKGDISQPNGSTKLCLSCHDGTIALGKVVSRASEISFAASVRRLNAGPGFLGTNLRDDHPVSFGYSSSRGGTSPDFHAASAILPPVRLDSNGEVQCTSCHDPHDNSLGQFLVTTDKGGALCLACHNPRDWKASSHSLSTATWNHQGKQPWSSDKYANVMDNACQNCHKPHGAGHPERLLAKDPEEDNCLDCHNGNVASQNIAAEITGFSAHDVTNFNGLHDPAETPLTMSRHVECEDCHNPHTSKAGTANAPNVPGPLFGVSGVNSSGVSVERISQGYELCYKCHADNHGATNYVSRVIAQTNVRLEFDPTNPSMHPIEAQGKNPDVPSLLAPLTTASRMACTDCHSSDRSPTFGGTGPRGPHGSRYRPILGLNYSTGNYVTESSANYALCYKCHSRSSILNDQSFKLHDKHIRGERTPCSVCHDPHGIASSQGNPTNNSHLINFDKNVVTQNSRGRLEFIDQGRYRGTCNLNCHGEDHDGENY